MLDVTAIPTDIWSLILPLACTDGGFTGKSLALTSTFFHVQASPFRFYSLAFDTLARMENFLAFVRRQPGDFRPQIAHLYISHSDHPNNRLQWSWRSVARMTEAQRRQYMRTIGEEKMDWTLNFQAAIDALLHLAAPNLLTLCIAGGCTPIVIRYSFPRLEELTGFNFLPDANVQSGSASGSVGVNDRDNNTRFPALKRAHIALGISRPVSSLILRPLLVATATLTHVRISNVDVAAMSRALAGALVPNVDANFFPEQPPPTSLFPPLVLPALR